jgi:hypothetical protein
MKDRCCMCFSDRTGPQSHIDADGNYTYTYECRDCGNSSDRYEDENEAYLDFISIKQ